MQYISDKIGNEYKEWREGDLVFISSPTGSGKTTFILKILLPYAISQRKRILYLVNRRVLKEQLQEQVDMLPSEVGVNIKIESYQYLESKISNVNEQYNAICLQDGMKIKRYALGNKGLQKLQKFDYVVCDECHYFLSDSNYNTKTQLSFNWISEVFCSKVQIFLSATIHGIHKYIMDNTESMKHKCTNVYKLPSDSTVNERSEIARIFRREKRYDYVPDYNYVDVDFFEKREDIIDILIEDRESKWLIFVDNISYGNQMKKELKEEIQQENKRNKKEDNSDKMVVMISSSNIDGENDEEKKNLAKKEHFNAKYLIATSVIDNGISIKDINLRKIVIIADTEVEFIQMLGRRRVNANDKLLLYIWKHNKNHFQNRIRILMKRKRIIKEYYQNVICKIKQELNQGIIQEEQQSFFMNKVNLLEKQCIIEFHCELLQKLSNNEIEYDDIKSVMYPFNGVYHINFLSEKQIDNLILYYDKILKKFEEEGENAFLREQLRWMGKTEEEFRNMMISKEKKCFDKVVGAIEGVKGKELSKDEAIELKISIKDELLYLVKLVDEGEKKRKTVIDAMGKDDRPLSQPNMMFLNKFCKLPYILEQGDGKYKFVGSEV